MVTHSFRLAVVASLGFALLLTGCASASSGVVGSWGNPDEPQQPSLDLSKDGQVTGTDGCNRLMGSYTVNGDEITFTDVASTLMYCEGVDTWLAQLALATVAGDEMTVYDLRGSELGVLKRSN